MEKRGQEIVLTSAKGEVPATLAEFTLATSSGQTFYDISLVDGYNLPVAIVSLYPSSGKSSLQKIPPNLTNPVCIGTASQLGSVGSTADAYLGSNSSYPLPLEESLTHSDVAGWCPWELQTNPPAGPSNGVYTYPDDSVRRPDFGPCYSACAKYHKDVDCCNGAYNSPSACSPSLYSQDAKTVCPDAYSYGEFLCPIFIFLHRKSILPKSLLFLGFFWSSSRLDRKTGRRLTSRLSP